MKGMKQRKKKTLNLIHLFFRSFVRRKNPKSVAFSSLVRCVLLFYLSPISLLRRSELDERESGPEAGFVRPSGLRPRQSRI